MVKQAPPKKVMLSFIQHGVKGFVYGLTLPGIDFVPTLLQRA